MIGDCSAPSTHARNLAVWQGAAAAQCIKGWYKRLPEEIGQELAKRATAGGVKSDKERMRLEALSEERYLKKEGHTQEEVEVRALNRLQHGSDEQATGRAVLPDILLWACRVCQLPEWTPWHCKERLLLIYQAVDASVTKVHVAATRTCYTARAELVRLYQCRTSLTRSQRQHSQLLWTKRQCCQEVL